MDPALRTAATGMIAQQTRTEVIANNLANLNTTGFKRSRAEFEDLLYQTVQGATNAATPDGKGTPAVQVGRGTRLVAVSRLHTQGTIEETQRPLDVAIEGEGFFQVQLANGTTAYTRDGSFQISSDGTLVTSSGDTIAPGIKIPPDASEISISKTGVVSAQRAGAAAPGELAPTGRPRSPTPGARVALGGTLYPEPPASGEPVRGFPQDE